MYKIRFVLFLVLMVGLIGCSTALSPTAVLPVESPTPTIQPAATSSPVPTATQTPVTPTLTPEPGLRTDGPYFGYFRDVPGRSTIQFVLMDADGRGRRVFDLPKNVTEASPIGTQYVSPDGKWLAFYTGYAGTPHKDDAQTTFDLTLNLLNLDTGEAQVITPLLSHDYPNNFAIAINEINAPDGLIGPEYLRDAFLTGIRSLAWSPDGQYFAFAGQMDGLSSDLYLYDMATKNIRLLSAQPEELHSIEWSPDGKWILEKNTLSSSDYAEKKVSVVALDNSVVHDLGHLLTGYWLNSHEVLGYGFGVERERMRLADINTGKITEIWRDNFFRYEIDPTGKWIAIDGFSGECTIDEKLGMDCNVKLINLKSPQKPQVPEPVFEVVGPGFARFLRAPDGTIIASPNSMIVASPDAQFWVEIVYHDVKIYTHDLTLVKEISIPLENTELNNEWPLTMQWSPDSSNLTLVYGKRSYSRYFVNIPSGDVNLVDTDLSRISGGWFNVDQ